MCVDKLRNAIKKARLHRLQSECSNQKVNIILLLRNIFFLLTGTTHILEEASRNIGTIIVIELMRRNKNVRITTIAKIEYTGCSTENETSNNLKIFLWKKCINKSIFIIARRTSSCPNLICQTPVPSTPALALFTVLHTDLGTRNFEVGTYVAIICQNSLENYLLDDISQIVISLFKLQKWL